ncbi:MAG: hypothetical protein R3337_13830, partial [Gammaproteobacteria bacterium]|nr:hypothetical protein [Gammaproteobacteria bacterium]
FVSSSALAGVGAKLMNNGRKMRRAYFPLDAVMNEQTDALSSIRVMRPRTFIGHFRQRYCPLSGCPSKPDWLKAYPAHCPRDE